MRAQKGPQTGKETDVRQIMQTLLLLAVAIVVGAVLLAAVSNGAGMP